MIAVVDYGIGNLRSAQKALEHLGADARLTGDPDEIREAGAVVLPGVGAFGACMNAVRATGLDVAVLEAVESGKPFMGICVGMQMLFESSDEAAGVAGLGVFGGTVKLLSAGERLVLPHMGWNTVTVTPGSRLLAGLPDPLWLYFVHSYAPVPTDESVVAGRTHYGEDIAVAVERDNVWATQFHPEKSGEAGLAVLQNFALAADAVRV